MPITQLDERSAFIAIDFQAATMGLPTVHPAAEVVENAGRLARRFRELGLPVVLVNVVSLPAGRTDTPGHVGPLPAEWTALAPELGTAASDHLIGKGAWDPFLNTGLDDILRQAGATQVVLAGISTSHAVESAARSAYGLGYNVALATDAMTDLSREAHARSVLHTLPMLGETGHTDDILKLLDK